MKNKVKCVELRTVDGKVILVLYLYEKEIILEDNPKTTAEKPEAKKEEPKASAPEEKEPIMTQAQKRYLFRILAEQGIEGDKAYQYLRDFFQVDSLKEVTKLEASKAIEHLIAEGKGGKNGIPF
jgi:hypothetical protein